jgi:hypothetical protein
MVEYTEREFERAGNFSTAFEAPCQDYGSSDKLDNAPADGPVVWHAERADLPIGWPTAVQEQEVGDPIVLASIGNTSFIHYRNASHDKRIWQL